MPSSLPVPDTYYYSTPARPPGNAAVSAATEYLTAARANAPFASGAPLFEGSNRKKARPSKTKPGKHLSKSHSTPLLRGPVMSDAESAADKKRNKLGYQRISIACAHCRRRKIRCLLAEDDPEQRCQNCIRLKKECVFYPVDQQAQIDAQSEASSKAGAPSGPSSTVSSSPTQLGTRQLNAAGQHFGGSFHNATSESPGGYQGIPIPPGGGIPSQGSVEMVNGEMVWSNHPAGGYAPQEYGYAPHRESPSWNPQEFSAQQQAMPVGGSGGMHPSFARYGSVAGDTALFPGSMEQQPQSARPADTFGNPPEHLQQQWQQQAPQPVRSMSYPAADYPGPNAFNPMFPIDHQPPGSYAQQQHLHAQHQDPRLVQIAPGQAPQHPQYMIPHNQRGSNMPVMPGYPQQQQMAANWYPDQSSFGHPGEEETRDTQYGGYPGRPR